MTNFSKGSSKYSQYKQLQKAAEPARKCPFWILAVIAGAYVIAVTAIIFAGYALTNVQYVMSEGNNALKFPSNSHVDNQTNLRDHVLHPNDAEKLLLTANFSKMNDAISAILQRTSDLESKMNAMVQRAKDLESKKPLLTANFSKMNDAISAILQRTSDLESKMNAMVQRIKDLESKRTVTNSSSSSFGPRKDIAALALFMLFLCLY